MNDVKSVVSAMSVSLGQFYRYLVRIHHGTLLDAENDFVQIPLHDDDEEGKEKREESKTSASLNALNINAPSVSAARTNKSSLVVFEGEKGMFMVRKWFKMRSRNFCEV